MITSRTNRIYKLIEEFRNKNLFMNLFIDSANFWQFSASEVIRKYTLYYIKISSFSIERMTGFRRVKLN